MNESKLREAAERVVREYLSERSTGSRVEDAIYRLKAALTRSQPGGAVAGNQRGDDPTPGDYREEIGRLRQCISMAMGCIDPESKNPDERLAWLRLLDGMEGREPRPTLSRPDTAQDYCHAHQGPVRYENGKCPLCSVSRPHHQKGQS